MSNKEQKKLYNWDINQRQKNILAKPAESENGRKYYKEDLKMHVIRLYST